MTLSLPGPNMAHSLMLHRILPLFALFICLPSLVQAQSWQLVWADEFDYTGLPDPTKWSYDIGANGWGNQESQYYTENRLENARVENGSLIIEARRELFSGSSYTSARLVSRGKGDWTYGRIEARAILPSGRGTWPAIWMLPTERIYGNKDWPDVGEIDIMEHVGFDPERVHGSIHVDRYNGLEGTHKTASKTIAGSLSQFHVYAIEWTPKHIRFLIDDVLYFRYDNESRGWTTWPFDNPFHLILNIAVGGTWGGQQGIDDSIFPAQMLIDYVRVYENTSFPTVALTNPTTTTTLAVGETLNLSADIQAPGAALDRVEFYQGDGLLGTATQAPYSIALENLSEGCYSVQARALDVDGWYAETPPQNVTVGTDCVQAPYLMVPAPLPGTIEAENYDLGGSNVAYRDLNASNEGSGPRLDEGVDLSHTGDGRTLSGYITEISSREWTEYTIDVQEAGTYRVEARVSAVSSGGSFALEFDGANLTGNITVPSSGNISTWTTARANGVILQEGIQTMRFNVRSGGFNIDSFTFRRISGTTTEAEVPKTAFLAESYPNPFAAKTTLALTLPQPSNVRVHVFNTYGQKLLSLPPRMLPTGTYTLDLDGLDWAPGMYLVQIEAADQTHTLKLLKGY